METKEIKINIPRGYEIDKENSTFECIKFKPSKKYITYKDICAKILVQAIAANPHNLSEAIREASKNLNRTYKACKQHWYVALSPKNNPTKVGISFISIGSESIYKKQKKKIVV